MVSAQRQHSVLPTGCAQVGEIECMQGSSRISPFLALRVGIDKATRQTFALCVKFGKESGNLPLPALPGDARNPDPGLGPDDFVGDRIDLEARMRHGLILEDFTSPGLNILPRRRRRIPATTCRGSVSSRAWPAIASRRAPRPAVGIPPRAADNTASRHPSDCCRNPRRDRPTVRRAGRFQRKTR